MKPKPVQAKNKNVETPKQIRTRRIYVRDDAQTKVGFSDHGEAIKFADTVLKADRNGTRDSETKRVRISYRNRTGLYDVVVKLAKDIPIAEEKAIGE